VRLKTSLVSTNGHRHTQDQSVRVAMVGNRWAI